MHVIMSQARDDGPREDRRSMRRSPLTLYAPLLAILLIQALIMAVAPSVAPDSPFSVDAGSGPTTSPDASGQAGPTSPDDGHPGTATPGPGGAMPSSPGGDGHLDTGATPGAPGTEASTTAPSSDPAAGDTSHCTRDGRQHGVVFHAPPCAPAWPAGADNGGATYRGVTADTVKVVLFRENKNEQVNALLNLYNLRATRAQDEQFTQAAEEYLNAFYEFHGRRVEIVIFDATNCPESPPDVPACRAEAQRAIAEHDPFIVFWPTAIYPTVFDEFARAGVIALGGWNFSADFFAGRRPFRYDIFMDGTRSADFVGEYYCKKLANGTPTHAGRVIHPSFPSLGARGAQERKLGIVTPETPANLPNAQRLQQIVADCDGHVPELFTYQADIERAQQQSGAIVRGMIDARVTTVVCLCDPVTPVFATQAATQNNYYPEHLLPGSGLLDFDLLGRIYDQQQMVHAFGPSHLQVFPEFAQTDAPKMARSVGRESDACRACNTNGAYFNLIGFLIQSGGPNLTPQSVEQGMFAAGPRGGWQATRGNPHEILLRIGPGDYTMLSDIKEVYWSRTARSPIDGQQGAYVATDNGRRYASGELPTSLNVPVPAQ